MSKIFLVTLRLVTAIGAALLFAIDTSAQAQTISVSPKTGRGVVDHTVTYTVPTGATCTLSGGGLAGSVTANGSKIIPAVTAPSTTYAINCPAALGNAVLTWTTPTKNTDGSTLTDLTGYKAYWGTSAASLTNSQAIAGATTSTTTINGLAPGTWFFALASISASGGEGNKTNVATKTLTGTPGGTASDTATVTPIPLPPSGLVVAEIFAYEFRQNKQGQFYAFNVGTIYKGKTCGDVLVSQYAIVDKADVKISGRVKYHGGVLFAQCKAV